MSDIRSEFKNIAEALFKGAVGDFSGLPDAAQKVFLTFCGGSQRARVVKGLGGTLRTAFDAAREQAVKIVSRTKELPKWVMVDIVEKEIHCTLAECYEVLCQIKPGFLRYGLSLDSRYSTAFLEQEIHACSLIKYSGSGHRLHTANITDYQRKHTGSGTGFTFVAPGPDAPVILFEVRSYFYDDGEYVEIDSSPASHHKGIRKLDFGDDGSGKLREAAAKIAAALSARNAPFADPGLHIDTAPSIDNAAADNATTPEDDAKFYALLPAVMFPEMAMFFESPEFMLYRPFLRRHNFKVRDHAAARFFADYCAKVGVNDGDRVGVNQHKVDVNDDDRGGINQHKAGINDADIYHLNSDFSIPPADMAHASVARLRLFEAAGIKSKIITARYNPNLREAAAAYGLAEGEYENVYDFFRCVKREELLSTDSHLTAEAFYTPEGELALEKNYRIENGKLVIMVIKLKFDGTWRCFADEDELLAFYLGVRAGAGFLIDDRPAVWGTALELYAPTGRCGDVAAAPPAAPVPHHIRSDYREKIGQTPKASESPLSAPRIITLTGFAEAERVEDLITAFAEVIKEIPNAELHIFGLGENPEDGSEAVKAVNRLKLRPSVNFRGRVDDLFGEYSSAGLFVISAAAEDCRAALPKAAAHGLPVIVYGMEDGAKTASTINSLIDNGDSGFLTGGAADELAERMLMLLEDPELHKELSDNAYAKSLEFGEAAITQKWLDIFCRDDRPQSPADPVTDPNEAAAKTLQLSIIIPHYNRPDMAVMCLDSIAVNDFPQELYEVILVDDCSTENIDVIRGYSKILNYRFHQLEENSGHASKPRNFGIAMAMGEYVLFVDSDDMISAGLLSESMKVARQGDCDAVVIPKISTRSTAAGFRTLTEDLTKIKLDGLGDLSVLVAKDNYAVGKLFRMSLIRQFGIHFPEKLKFSEDTCFCRWFYAVSHTMGICASESYFVKEWDSGTLSHYKMNVWEVYEHVSFITSNIFSVPDEFAPIHKKARALDSSLRLEVVHALLVSPYYTGLLKRDFGDNFAAIRNAPRITEETRKFVDAVGRAKAAQRKAGGKKEIVFMPYKASMWDSLESIWLAAKDDPDCEAYVVPIPYYTLKPDRSFDELKYEGGDFPKYVPVTHYGEYDLSARMPDIIYIHNPYDDNNKVTSVAPGYYSWELEKYTAMLVYVPYYIGIEITPANEKHVIPIYCARYTDKIITQSENHSEFYAKTINPQKLAALGSPKIDKVVNTKKEDCPLPEEWKKIIGNKKVILYNTHLVNIYDPKIDIIAKLRDVMSVFEKRDDAILWWRPHPLTESTIKSMNPAMLDGYRKAVEDYKNSGTGIYDDTQDLHRALAWSDAYYGDGGSLLQMYGVTGKPMMIQNVNIIPRNEHFRYLMFNDIYDDGENLWFTVPHFNALFKMNKQTWAAEYVGSFPNEMMHKPNLYNRIAEYGGKLYFTPLFASEIAVYDIMTGKFEKISFAEPEIENKEDYKTKAKFSMVTTYKKHIFFIGCIYPAIIRLDTETGILDYFTDWVEPLEKISSGDGYYLTAGHISENKLILPALNANAVVIFDMDKCVSKIYEVGSKELKYGPLCYDGENYWLRPRCSGPVVRWNPDTEECREYNNYPTGFERGELASFVGIHYWDGYVWLLPRNANMALKINIENGSMTIAEEFQSVCEFKGEEVFKPNYLRSKTIGDKIYAHTGKTNRFIEYDCKTKQWREEGIVLTEEAVEKLNEDYSKLYRKDIRECSDPFDCTFIEHACFRLQDFINYAANEFEEKTVWAGKQIELFSQIAENTDGSCGIKIHEYIKSEVSK